ncbi:MAG: carboxylating nicotinate-nucleotide diphosphorylase [Gemmatimonadota bacterium]|nr:carboxylating nicotinate-nucleotide diphosphorylase [Gemmatimonadota bacterium]
MSELPRLYPLLYEELIRRALQEDLGRAGDLTTDAIVAWGSRATAHVVARAAGTVAGLEPALHAVCLLDPAAELELHALDGTEVEREDVLAVVRGSARALLSAERTALNLLGRLSGIATATRGIVRLIEGTGARVVCTRKTTPVLRTLEKHAVRAGGGMNHRFGLDDGVLIKDNHRALAGGIRPALERVRAAVGHMVKVEVEVDTLEELAEALELGVDAVLLDNMSVDQLREAVSMARGRALTEASGGITPQTARAVAETGVDLLSLGWLTHSSPALDVALDVQL